jgi:hypothetical protein
MSLNQWALGAVSASFMLAAGSTQAAPLPLSPIADSSAQTVQFLFFDSPPPPPVYYDPPPPPVYYDPPPRPYYRDYAPPARQGYYAPPDAYYGPPRGRGGPPHRYAEPRVQPHRDNRGNPPQI